MAPLFAKADSEVESATQAKDDVGYGAVVQEEEGHRLLYVDCWGRSSIRGGAPVARQSRTYL